MEGLVVVYRAAGITQAALIQGFLESEGIPADLDYESAGPAIGLTMDGLGEVRVCVPEAFADEARIALASRLQVPAHHLRLVEFPPGESAGAATDDDRGFDPGETPQGPPDDDDDRG